MSLGRLNRGAPSLLGRELSAHGAAYSAVSPLQFRTAPLLAAAVCFAGGILLAQFWRPSALLVIAVVLLIVVAFLAVLRAPRVALPCAMAVWAVLGWACAEMRPPPVISSALLPYEDGLRRDVRGSVVRVEALPPPPTDQSRDQDPVHPWESPDTLQETTDAAASERAWSIDLALDAVEQVTPDISKMVPANGGFRLTLYGTEAEAQSLAMGCGDTLRVPTRLLQPQQFRDPGVWQRGLYLASSGVIATGSAKLSEAKREGRGAASFSCRVQQARTWAASRMTDFARWERGPRLPGHSHLAGLLRWSAADAGEVNAMLLGDRIELQRSLRVQFERTGTFHLFVVAGFHVSIVAGGLYWLLLRLRCPRWLAVLLALTFTSGYALLTGFGEPVQRALLMTAAFFLARLLSRQRSVLNAAGLAVLAMLIFQPQSLFDAGLQMTVLVALTIGGVAAPLLERTLAPYGRACRRIGSVRVDRASPPRIAQFRSSLRVLGLALGRLWGKPLERAPAFCMRLLILAVEFCILSLVTECVMAVPMAVYFHRLVPLALPANLLLVPLLPFLMAGSLATFLLALVSNWLALVPGMLTAVLLHWTAAVVNGVGGLPLADWRLATPPHTAVACAILLFAFTIAAVRSRSRAPAWAAVAALPLIAALACLPYAALLHPGLLEVTAIDVGQGDSILLAGPDGATMLVDAGGVVGSEATARARLANFDIGEQVISPYLWSRGIRRLDVLALTHAHMDHIGGMAAVLRNFRPRELWVSVDADSQTYRELLALAAANGTRVRHLHAADQFDWSGSRIQVVSPSLSYTPRDAPTNDDSLVLRIEHGRASVLLEGDAERPSEAEMARDGMLRPATLLKVGHHGSNSSTTDELVERVTPRAAIISCGHGNRFGHPRMPVLQRLQAAHVSTARTDTMGATQYLLHSDGSLETNILSAGSATER